MSVKIFTREGSRDGKRRQEFFGVGGGMRQGAFYVLQVRGRGGVGELTRRGPRQDDEGLGGECLMLWGTGAML